MRPVASWMAKYSFSSVSKRTLLISRGDATVFFTRPLSAFLMATAAFLLVLALLPTLRKKRDEVFVESET